MKVFKLSWRKLKTKERCMWYLKINRIRKKVGCKTACKYVDRNSFKIDSSKCFLKSYNSRLRDLINLDSLSSSDLD